MFWTLLYIAVFLVILSEIKFRWQFRSLRRFPGAIDIPLIGMYFHFINDKLLIRNMFRMTRYYGDIVRCTVGRQLVLLISNPEMLEFFLHSPKFTAKADNYLFLEPWLGRGIFNSHGADWHKARKLMTPAFHFNIMENHVALFQPHCDVLIDVLRKNVDSNLPVDIYPKIVHFTLDIITETAIGIKSNVQNNTNIEFLNAMHFMTHIIIARTLSIWKRFDILFRLSSLYRKQQKCLKIIEDYSIKAIEQRREILLKNSAQNSESEYSNEDNKKKILLDILLTSTIDGKPLSNDKIRTEVNSIIFGGHDTTASTISIMMYALANNTDVQDKIVAELKEIYGNDRDRPVSMQDLKEMRYMDLVIKEVLRYYGVVPFIGRKVTEDVNYKGTIIPKETTLVLFIFAAHKSSSSYENYKEFNPERFSSANLIKPFSFIPFSAGPRNCLGQKYAVNEVKVTFAKLLRHFKLESAGPDYKMDLQAEMVMKPMSGIYVKIQSRDF